MVKGGFSGDSEKCGKPADARVTRGSGVLSLAGRMDADTLPKQARYQLRYTRIRETLYRISREKAIEISLGFAFLDGGWYNGRKRRDDAWKRGVSFARRS